jgi:hypothetical protein
MIKYHFNGFFKNICVVFLWIVIQSCAQIMAPTGGPRDTEPPVISSCIPENASIKVRSSKIEINFNEYIVVKDASTWLVSPPQQQTPEYKIKGKSLTIELKDSLKPNTTYNIEFGRSIADFTEGNSMASFNYIFSTGNFLDSLSISGEATNAQSGKPEKDISIFLYKEEKTKADSFLFKADPDFFSDVDESGRFNANYLPSGKFLAVSIGDKNKNNRFDPPDEWIGYAPELISTTDTSKNESLKLRFFKVTQPQYLKKSESNKPAYFMGVFNRPYLGQTQSIIGRQDSLFIAWSLQKDTLQIWDLTKRRDSLLMLIYDEKQPTPDTLNIRFKKSPAETSKENIIRKSRFNLHPICFPNKSSSWKRKSTQQVYITHENPISVLKDNLVQAYAGAERISSTWKLDSEDPRKIIPEIAQQYQDSSLKFVFLPGAIEDFLSQKNDTVTLLSALAPAEDFGNLNLTINGSSQHNCIIELVNESGKLKAKQISKFPAKMNVSMLEPSTYKIKIVLDENENGLWDEGNPNRLTQPEKIIFPDKSFEIRANWDLEEEINISE